jgi:hypothetical protein
MKPSWRGSAGIIVAAMAIGLAGCGGSSSSFQSKTPQPAVKSLGEAFGGQQPVSSMTIQMFDAGTGGYGSAATALLSTATDSNGKFNFASNPSCASDPNNQDQIYLVGTGGDPIVAGNGTNSSLALMLALGDCGRLNGSNASPITHVHMNELTTVAAVWALAPFMSGNTQAYQKVGTSATNAAGLRMAFQAANQVVNIDNGTLPGTLPAGATLGQAEVNTIADALEFCINSIDGSGNSPSANCSSLFTNAPSQSGNPGDTITAAMNIAQNPARNVATLDQGISNTSTFQPIVGSPTAFTIAIQYTGGGLHTPTAIAADGAGQIWVANAGSTAVSLFDNLGNSKLGTTGTALGGTPQGVAIDLNGNAWVTASDNNVYELSSSGTINPATPFTGFNGPTGIAVDPAGYIWVVNNNDNTVSAFNSTGAAMSGSPFSGAGIASPVGIAINGNANANCADCH